MRKLLLDWCSQCFFNRPFLTIKSLEYSVTMNAGSLRPFSDAKSNTFVGYHAIKTVVPVLLFWGSPSAILRIVSLRIIDPIKGMLRRTRPHVFIELSEGINPRFTNSNPFVCGMVLSRIKASFFHRTPASIFWSKTPAVLCRKLTNCIFFHVIKIRINEILNGLEDRQKYFALAKKTLGI